MVKKIIFLFVIISVMVNCRATVKNYKNDDKVQYDASYTYTDLQSISQKMSDSISSSDIIKNAADKPVMIIYGISNRTSEHIDTKGLSDSIRTKLFKSGKVLFVSKSQRDAVEQELAYQYNSGNVNPSLKIEKARQVGAQLMLTGRIMSIEKKQPRQFRLKKRNLVYYKLTLELTDIKTGLMVWTDETEIVRESRKPLIGW